MSRVVMQDECEGRVQVYSGAGHVLSCEAAAHGAVAGLAVAPSALME